MTADRDQTTDQTTDQHTDEHRPARREPLQAGLYDETADGPRLIGGSCGSCRSPHFPLNETCPYCGGRVIERIGLSGRGVLWGATTVSNAPPGYDGPIPYGFGVVELPEGIRVVTRIIAPDPSALDLGIPMTIVLDDVRVAGELRPIYAFAPVTALSDGLGGEAASERDAPAP